MYYPKSKIITNLYTNGDEFAIKNTNEPYIGFYHRLYTGAIFTGKNPDDDNIKELISFSEIVKTQDINNKIIYHLFDYTDDYYLRIESSGKEPFSSPETTVNLLDLDSYESLKPRTGGKLIPSFYYPKLTQKEYDLGEFQRYFVKKTNELVYLEINKDDYTAIKNKDPKYAYESYIPFTFAWQIYGNRIDILQVNRNTVLLQEQNLKLRGLQEFLQNKYDKYYQYPVVNNLNTKGEELQRAGRIEYTGLYHVEADRGFVVGAQPSNIEIQSTLFAVNLEKEKILLDNALKAIGKFVYPVPIYDVIRKK
jgi:hypothetical protein